MNMSLALSALLLPILSAAQVREGGDRVAVEINRFEKDIVSFETADRESPPPQGAILFVGDSQFRRWTSIHEDLKGYAVINRGRSFSSRTWSTTMRQGMRCGCESCGRSSESRGRDGSSGRGNF